MKGERIAADFTFAATTMQQISFSIVLLSLPFHLLDRAGSSVMAAYVEIIFDNSDGELKR
jgi:hypothetical protein